MYANDKAAQTWKGNKEDQRQRQQHAEHAADLHMRHSSLVIEL